jgi:hypothetical protein
VGYDAIGELLSAFNCLPGPEITVVMTGAQFPATGHNADGPGNIADALKVAVHPEALGRGPMLVICIGVKRVYVELGGFRGFHALFIEAARRPAFHRYRENGKKFEVSPKSAQGFLFAPTAPNSLKLP